MKFFTKRQNIIFYLIKITLYCLSYIFRTKQQLFLKAIYFNFRVKFMNLELIGQLVSVALIVGAGPIIIGALFARGGNL